MKLFTRYNRINLLATVSIFLIASLVFYFFLQQVLISQVDEDLKIKRTEILTYANKHYRLPDVEQQPDQQIFFIKAAEKLIKNRFRTIAGEGGEEDLRELSFSIHLPIGWYTVTINKSLEGTDHLIRSVALIVLLIVLLILTVSFIINRIVIRRLWQPFYSTLAAIQAFRLGNKEPLQLPKSKTDEFIILNATIRQTTEMAGKDYELLKEFTENASHELQTPLAVIRSKLEMLMQYELNEPQSKAVQSATEALKGLVRLNKSLLLLTKIQNNQYAEKESVNLKTLIEEKVTAFEELFTVKGIAIYPTLENVQMNMNIDLANLLVSNLMSNAIKHNKPSGQIYIVLNKKELMVGNTSLITALDENKLFTRFYNPGKAVSSTGLGLSIVKQICQVSEFEVGYQYFNDCHQFTIFF